MQNHGIQKKTQGSLIRSNLIHWSQFVQRTGVCPYRLSELVEMGWVEAIRISDENFHFPEREILRVQKLMRICRDFELPTIGGTIIVDLLERIEVMEKEITQLRNLI
ncbi:chaperone modulator CbpM [Desulfonatronovibrio hydrogenovorans]|uniref:chaperone modulator CbpM n=1 Tax=Desulfonatronovibrio hydrogenovorans TaxID=53245 RepID=UPI0006913CAC|nr:chaperone modulator CbpM [Desulfonatronovibrio hydrogenovorans]